jgi:hypothetical protein
MSTLKPHPVPSCTQEINGTVYWTDAGGRLTPEYLVKEIDKERDALVRGLVGRALALQAQVQAFRHSAFGDVQAFVDLSAEQYGVTFRGAREGGKGNVTLFSFDGRYKIVRKNADLIKFDERLMAAKLLIDECLLEWTQGARDEIRALVNDAFQVDKAGRINTGRVLSLRRLNIQDATWQEAMRAIGEATVQIGTATYLHIYERIGAGDDWRLIAVDLAAAGRGSDG